MTEDRIRQIFEGLSDILTDKEIIVEKIISSINKKEELLITYIHFHSFNLLYSDFFYRDLILNHFTKYADGIGMIWPIKLLEKKKIKNKFNASEINEIILNFLISNRMSVNVIGGNFKQETLKRKELTVENYFNGYKDIQDFESVVRRISYSKSKIVIIGMSVPLQEKLAYALSQRINDLQIICVGNFLEFFFGTKPRAPKLLHNSGFEWLFRLITEPKRLWKRYLLGIPLFIFRIIILKIKCN